MIKALRFIPFAALGLLTVACSSDDATSAGQQVAKNITISAGQALQ